MYYHYFWSWKPSPAFDLLVLEQLVLSFLNFCHSHSFALIYSLYQVVCVD